MIGKGTLLSRFKFKLIGAFILVILVAIAVVYFTANYSVSKQFRLYVVRGALLQAEPLREELLNYYRERGSWQGVRKFLEQQAPWWEGGQGQGRGRSLALIGLLQRKVILASSDGKILLAPDPKLIGRQLPPRLTRQGLPLVVGNERVGVLLAGPAVSRALDPLEREFLSSVNRSLLLGGLAAGLLAIFLGTVLSRGLTGPLTELTRATERLAAGELSHRVRVSSQDELGRLGAAFNRMAEELERSERLRRQMIADIAHELRTPLTVIQGELEALHDGVFEPTPERLAQLQKEAHLLGRLVEDLHELALAEAGELRLERGPTDLIELIQRVGRRFEPQLGERGLELKLRLKLKLDIDAEPPEGSQGEGPEPELKLDLDADRIEQVLHNLLSNAARYTPAGGQITIEIEDKPDEVIVSVADTGSGIAPEDLPHIFERFYRADKSRSRREGGAGLGLAIAKGLVEAHGGRIWAESEPGRGTKISFALPKSEAG